MSAGIPGTGPYSKIRDLYREIDNLKYRISLIDQGIKKKGRKGLEKEIKEKRAEIKEIRDSLKKKTS